MTASMSSATTNTLPTPAHSVNGATSHPSDMPHDASMSEDSPHKRKRALDDMGDRAHKKVHLEDAKLSIEDLHLDVGNKYLLCRTPHPPSFPSTCDDLFEKFNLNGLAAEVAREKPNGEKNALRKTYKGHIKRLGIMGHFDAVRKESSDPAGLMAMLSFPDQEWHIHNVQGRDIQDGLSALTEASLSKAMSMAKGPIPRQIWDSSVLGELVTSVTEGSRQPPSGKPTAPNTPAAAVTPAFMARVKLQGATDPQVQKMQAGLLGPAAARAAVGKNLKKRGFGDGGFEGYSEGFQDDGEAGYSTGEDRSGQKRRKKNPGNGQPQSGPMRQNGFGPPAVGA